MCAGRHGPSVDAGTSTHAEGAMRTSSLLAGAVAALATALGAPPGALAADAVFGGSTAGDEPIVIKADKTAKKLRSAVIGWSASCEDGASMPLSTKLTATPAQTGFSPGPRDLVMTRNRKRRFAGTQRLGLRLGGDL